MSEEKKEEPPKVPGKRVFAESLGRYTIVDGQKVYQFVFNGDSTLPENYGILSFLRDEIWRVMEDQRKAEAAAKAKPKEEPKKEVK